MKHSRVLLDLVYLLFQLANSMPQLATADEFGTYQLANATSNHYDFYINGTLILAGLFPIHYAQQDKSSSQHCRGKFNIRGFEEALAMVYALEQINKDLKILPGITIGADIKDSCSSVDFAIRKCLNFSFVKRNIESLMCVQRGSVEHDPKTVAIVSGGSSDVAMAVTNFAGLFYVPVVSYSASSRLLSNRIRFNYFLRTVSSDTLMARAVVDLLRALKWNFVHVLYSDTDYGRSAVETFEHVLGASAGAKICLAVKRTFTKHTSDTEIKSGFVADIRAKQNAKAKAVLLFTTVEDTELILNHFDDLEMMDYVFISTDHFTGPIKSFQSSRQMLSRIVGVTPHRGRADKFDKYLASVKESYTGCPWMEEYNKQHLKDLVQHSIYVPYVVDAVYATAYGLHRLLNCTQGQSCQHSPDEFPILSR